MMKRNFIAWSISILLLLIGSCTKVMDLSDEATLTSFKVKSITPNDIELGAPVIKGDTITIPVNRGVTLFPMSISAELEYSANTDQAVTGTTFDSFSDIKFDLGDIHFNTFYLVAKSGMTKPYYIKLAIDDQNDRNDFKALTVTGTSQSNAVVATKGFINPAKRTITLYATETSFPLEVTATATLSDSAYIKAKDQTAILDCKEMKFNFSKYSDSLIYVIEAENGAKQDWKISLEKAIEADGTESSDIKSALSLNQQNQRAVVMTSGYKINEIVVDNEIGKMIFIVAPLARNINVEILPYIKTLTNSQLVGYKDEESLLFESYTSTKDFIILDSRTGYYKKWKFALLQGDVGDVLKFPYKYTSAKNYLILDSTQTVIDNINKIVTLKVTKTTSASSYWPLKVVPGDVKYSNGAVLNIADTLVYANINTIPTFKLTSALGDESEWKVKLLYTGVVRGDANIDSIKVTSSSYPLAQSDMIINTNTADVFIDLKDRNAFPLRIQPFLYISDGAEFEDFQNGDFIEFNSFDDTVKLNIISRPGEIKTWKFQLLEKSQLYNSDFELWVTSGTSTIDPIPGRARGWATANNIMIKGTNPVNNGANGKAAEMSTAITSLPKNLITAGTLFLGYFDMSTITLDKPRNMTKFGIPFEARPIAIAVDAKYTPGPKYQKSAHVSGSGIGAQYKLEDLEGEDRGQIWVELIHYSGSGQLKYNGEATDGVTVLARGEYVVTGDNDNWSRLNIPLARKPEYDQYQPTHLVVVMASSIDGHLFIGAKDSKLTVDNFELIY